MSDLDLFRIVLLILINTPSDVTVSGLLLCGVLEALEVYGPDTICCNHKTYPMVDVDNRKRNCCVDLLYYSDEYECVNGKLQSLNPPVQSPSAPSRRKKKKPKIRIVRINFSNSDVSHSTPPPVGNCPAFGNYIIITTFIDFEINI